MSVFISASRQMVAIMNDLPVPEGIVHNYFEKF
jgi:hypothetical protein